MWLECPTCIIDVLISPILSAAGPENGPLNGKGRAKNSGIEAPGLDKKACGSPKESRTAVEKCTILLRCDHSVVGTCTYQIYVSDPLSFRAVIHVL